MDRETMTCCEKETQLTQLWYKNAATVIGCGVKKWISQISIMKTKKMHIQFLILQYDFFFKPLTKENSDFFKRKYETLE